MILIFGTICLDRVRLVPHMPEPGGYVEVASERLLLGGEAANTANALRVWGGSFRLAGNGLGHGPLSLQIRNELKAHGLAVIEDHLSEWSGPDDPATPVCDVYVSQDGVRTMIGVGFSQMDLTVNVERLPFETDHWFTAEPNMPEGARKAAKLAHEHGMKMYLMDFVSEDDPIYPGSFWQSSTDWAGVRGDCMANLAYVRRAVERRECFAILSDGPNGFVAGSPDLPARSYPPYPPGQMVDATGAGDIFRAGMLFGLDQRWPTSRCLQFASAAGCLACRSLGATTDVPTRDEVDALVSNNQAISSQYK